MHYLMSSRWSLMERFEITDEAGMPQFEARGHLGSQITLHDSAGREVADVRKHVFTDTHEVYIAGRRAAEVRHGGFIGDQYNIQTSAGQLTARGHFDGGDYALSRGGAPVAQMLRKFSARENLAIDIADGENTALLLALMLAIEAIHEERRAQDRGGSGVLGGFAR